jgi:hypothetical protein
MAKLGYTWYPKDWGNSEAVFELTLLERGLYRELIDMAMLNDNKTVINYKVWARKFGSTKDELETILITLKKLKLLEIENSEIFIPSCEPRLNMVRGARKGGSNSKPNSKSLKNLKKPIERLVESFPESLLETKLKESKVKETKLKGNKKVYSKEVHDCLNICLLEFTENLIPKNNDSWLDTIDKLNRIEGIHFSEIELIVKKVRNDDFWKVNFLSINKLRKKDNNGIMYFTVFQEKFKTSKSSEIKSKKYEVTYLNQRNYQNKALFTKRLDFKNETIMATNFSDGCIEILKVEEVWK